MNTIYGSDCCNETSMESTNVDSIDLSSIDLSSIDLTDYAKKSYVNAQDNLKLNKSGDRMSGDLNMNNNSITNLDRPSRSTDAANKHYIDQVINNIAVSRVAKRGDSMTGNLRMNNNLIQGLPTTYPPRNYAGSEAVSWEQVRRLVSGSTRGFATTNYVNSRISKPIITVCAEEKGALSVGAFEWSFGNGSDGLPHALSGYPMMAPGRILRMGMSLNLTNIKIKVAVTVNGNIAPGTDPSVTKDFDVNSGTASLSPPIEVNQGDRINFQTRELHDKLSGGRTVRINSTPSATGVVCLLIELDI